MKKISLEIVCCMRIIIYFLYQPTKEAIMNSQAF